MQRNRDIPLAYKNFKEALKHNLKEDLLAEYGQFLILNADSLTIDPLETATHLYTIIIDSNSDNSSLRYSKLESESICDILKDTISQKNSIIIVNPKSLAYYLLIKYPKYILQNDNIDRLLGEFNKLCDNLQDEIGFRLLADAYKATGNEELALQYFNYAELLEKVDDLIIGKIKLDNNKEYIMAKLKGQKNLQGKRSIDLKIIYDIVKNLEKAGSYAILENRFNDAEKLYLKMFNIYTKMLLDQNEESLLEQAINNLATIYFLNSSMEEYVNLKLQYNITLNKQLIELSDQNLNEALELNKNVEDQILYMNLLQQQPQLQEKTNANEPLKMSSQTQSNITGESCTSSEYLT